VNDNLKMDLADCGSPERLLEVLFRFYPDLPRQVPIEMIAAAVGIVDFRTLEAEGFIGALIADPEKNNGVILVKEGLPEKRKRYTQGHELGHFLIPSHGYQRQCSKKDLEENSRTTAYQRQEAEANRFSAGLLMPKFMFVRDMDALGSIDASHIRQLSDLFNVSMQAVANRYIDLSPESCAVVFSHHGTMQYCRASRDFPPLTLFKGSPLPEAAITRRYDQIGGSSSWVNHHGGIWVQVERGERAPTILEQAMCQSNGFKVTLLYVDERQQEEEDEADSLAARWEARLR
jgi:Zn-dependent peptidase ImmA (M78 family)